MTHHNLEKELKKVCTEDLRVDHITILYYGHILAARKQCF